MTLVNNVKKIIQKEEYISLAINKYIIQTGKIPKKNDNTLDWDKLLVDEYLGSNFNRINPAIQEGIIKVDLTGIVDPDILIEIKSIKVIFDSDNNCYIQGMMEQLSDYDDKYKYLYNFYINKIFRVNTLSPETASNSNLLKGSQVIYSDLQKEIVSILNEGKNDIYLDNQTCSSGKEYYQLKNQELTLMYCKNASTSIQVYQEAPIYLENYEDLAYVKTSIGDKAYVSKNGFWYEYYYQGDVIPPWVPTGSGSVLNVVDNTISLEDRILSYIPDSKDLVLRDDGGCMLSNGDIFCWGSNKYKRAGIENHGQLDSTLSSDYVNTPVMLKVQIDDKKQLLDNNNVLSTRNDKKWYNNPYRIKFEKMARTDKNICGISPIFDYYENGVNKKLGGDLYCNGTLNSADFEDLGDVGTTTTSILKRNKFIHTGKDDLLNDGNEIYLIDIVMVDGVWLVLSDAGKIYTVGSNEKGALGINNSDETFYTLTPQLVNKDGQVFKKIYALRSLKNFGAIDSNNYFWMWGERKNGSIMYEPTILSSSKKFNENMTFVNTEDFVLKGVDNIFYRTYDTLSYKSLSNDVPSSALSVAIYDYNGYELFAYVDENMQLKGSSEILTCRKKDTYACNSDDSALFTIALDELNSLSNTINGKSYANFSNVGIFESKITTTVGPSYYTYTEDFEDNSNTGWNTGGIYDGSTVASKFLGRFGKGNIDTSSGSQVVYKTFDLGSTYANQNVKITFDMYEIDSWDANQYSGDNLNGKSESFFVYINDLNVAIDIYAKDITYPNLDTKSGVALGDIPGTEYHGDDEKHTYSYVVSLDSNGRVKLGFGAILGEDYTNESFGIDNISISTEINNVAFSGTTYLENFENSSSQDWNVPRGPAPSPSSQFVNYPIYEDYNYNLFLQKVHQTYFLGRFNRVDGGGGAIYHGNSDGSQEVYKVFSFGPDYANKEVNIEYDFYRIDDWRNDIYYTIDKFYSFINDTKKEMYPNNAPFGNLNDIADTSWQSDRKYHYSQTVYLDDFGNVKLGFGAYIKDNYINQTSWGVDNIKFTLTGNSSTGSGSGEIVDTNMPYICTMTGLDSASQMYCWGNVGRSIPILSTSLYDVSKISTINKLFISQESEKLNVMSFDEFDNNGNLFLKYPTYIGGFDYKFYFK